jgi:hypothetical protein
VIGNHGIAASAWDSASALCCERRGETTAQGDKPAKERDENLEERSRYYTLIVEIFPFAQSLLPYNHVTPSTVMPGVKAPDLGLWDKTSIA